MREFWVIVRLPNGQQAQLCIPARNHFEVQDRVYAQYGRECIIAGPWWRH